LSGASAHWASWVCCALSAGGPGRGNRGPTITYSLVHGWYPTGDSLLDVQNTPISRLFERYLIDERRAQRARTAFRQEPISNRWGSEELRRWDFHDGPGIPGIRL